jgi:negative regulator of flagellin synthesis FlgM
MVDPISFGPLRPVKQRKPATASAASKAPVSLAGARHPTTAVSLSKLTAIARELAAGEPPVDFARIAQIRQAISLGSYRIDPTVIADAMLRHHDSGKP